MNGYDLSRNWWNFAFENPELVKPAHAALYFFSVEHCNRLGWKKKFGLPTEMAKDAIGIRSYNTYKKTFDDLVDFGFFEVIEYSKNQYSSNIIALSNFDKALDKALDKATLKHMIKHGESTVQSIDSINKPRTINLEQGNKETKDLPPEKKMDPFSESDQIELPEVFPEAGGVDTFIQQLKNTLSSYQWEAGDNREAKAIFLKLQKSERSERTALDRFKGMFDDQDIFHKKNFNLKYFNKHYNKIQSSIKYGADKGDGKERKAADGYKSDKWKQKYKNLSSEST